MQGMQASMQAGRKAGRRAGRQARTTGQTRAPVYRAKHIAWHKKCIDCSWSGPGPCTPLDLAVEVIL